MRLGIIGATENEIKPLIQVMSVDEDVNIAKLSFHVGTYSNIDVVAVCCGVCKVNAAIAAQILIDKFDVSHIIVTGVAGAIDKQLNICDTVIASEVAYHDVADEILTVYHPWMETIYFKADKELLDKIGDAISKSAWRESVFVGKIVTGESFIAEEGRDEIIEKYNPLCVDMETAGIAHVCYVNSIPFIAIRSMSDTPAESGTAAFEKYYEAASIKSVEILKVFLDGLSE